VQGAAWAGIAATHSPWAAAAAFLFIGAGSNIGTVALVTLRQELTPDELLGRVTSVFRLFSSGISALATLAGGAAATGFGLHAPLVLAVALFTAVTAATLTRRRPL
jgi:hypothetical protein